MPRPSPFSLLPPRPFTTALRARSGITCTLDSPASGALRCCESLVWQSHTARSAPSIASRIRRPNAQLISERPLGGQSQRFCHPSCGWLVGACRNTARCGGNHQCRHGACVFRPRGQGAFARARCRGVARHTGAIRRVRQNRNGQVGCGNQAGWHQGRLSALVRLPALP